MSPEKSVSQAYCGRFAPSPTGPLHFGSLIAAVGSYLEALKNDGQWLLRIDDIDPPREMAGAADDIQRTLEYYGFEWDGATDYQSAHTDIYDEAFAQLVKQQRVFACGCSRKTIAATGASIYPGTCRTGMQGGVLRSWRFLTEPQTVSFKDGVQGECQVGIEFIGDFVLKRAEGYFSYHLATAVDDASSGITHVVRGADLLDMTYPQIYIQKALALKSPEYAHLPVVLNENNMKLSKQNLAPPLSTRPTDISIQLHRALTFLGQNPPAEMNRYESAEIWHWAVSNWRLDKVPRVKHQAESAANIEVEH